VEICGRNLTEALKTRGIAFNEIDCIKPRLPFKISDQENLME
jgi:hypothetical protein